jgi:O-antigen/teichoic acid export membrane protein
VARILTGSVLGQGAVLGVSPLLTRLYEPRDFGALVIVTSVSSVIGALATLSWERAVIATRSEAMARALALFAVLSASAICFVVGIVAYEQQALLDSLFATHVFESMWWAVPVTGFALALQRIVGATLTRRRNYRALAVRNASQGLVQAASSLALSVAPGAFGLIVGPIAGRIAGSLGARRGEPVRPNAQASRRAPTYLSRRVFRITATRYRRYPLVSTWSSTLNALGLQTPTLLLSAAFGSTQLGLVGLALRLVATPVGIAADALAQFYDGAIGGRIRERGGGTAAMTLKLVGILAVVAFVSVGGVILTSSKLIPLVFGNEWAPVVPIVQMVAVMSGAQLIASPISRGLMLVERQRTQLAWDAGRFVLTNGAILVVTVTGGDLTTALGALVAASVASYATLVMLTLVALQRRDRRVARS